MNATYAVVSDGVVVNMIIIDTSAASDQAGDYGGQLVPAKDNAGICWSWDGTAFTAPPVPEPTPEEQRAAAEQFRDGLLQNANKVTADWRTELALGIISDEEKAKLILWMQYIKAVKAVDVSTAPDIDWPEKPE
ncbi:TPA: tail fiber assembly protein [Citrobacter freundii]|uniref:tail fiber assembly protein n=1 Tax=Citrobacter freundii TaxID=546 RepID=UPI001A25915F|nr:tail fiber assembly protein [Citrobacter freundii]MCY3449933.1 tail fiber assembly protein [Citrobacter freundii]HCD1227728.1 tail fiber assembly protein [Citrobacter freundii]HDT6513481.1 tail fiber assembly protein [Citrobacter freundii]HEE9963820.1 tail fiber assembly protein [Citrobacter freundii]HEE9979280.1 tail fiber assembly protein [Citrobacter freundii]